MCGGRSQFEALGVPAAAVSGLPLHRRLRCHHSLGLYYGPGRGGGEGGGEGGEGERTAERK